jgi:hypothetical protein
MMYLSSKKYARILPIDPNEEMKINAQLRRLHEANCVGDFKEQSTVEYSDTVAGMMANYMQTDRYATYSGGLFDIARQGSFSVVRK